MGEDNMRMLGKRNPYFFNYKIGFDSEKRITAVESSFYCDAGWNFNRIDSPGALAHAQSCYQIPALKYTPYGVKTHTPSNTPCRAPASTNGHALIEHIMEHSAVEMGLDPTELRLINQMTQGSPIIPPPKSLETANPIPDYVTQLKQAADFE